MRRICGEAILNPSAHITQGYAPIMPTYQGQVSEEGLISLVEYIKNLEFELPGAADDEYQRTAARAAPTRFQARPTAALQPERREVPSHEHTIVSLPDQATARVPKRNYLTNENGLMSWLLTGDHKRIAILYLISITFFFFIGGALAGLIRLELLTPQSDLMAADTYNKIFTMHGVVMIFLFLVPSVPATLGNFLIPIMIGAKRSGLPQDQPAELVPVPGGRRDDAGGDDHRRRGYGLDVYDAAVDALFRTPT